MQRIFVCPLLSIFFVLLGTLSLLYYGALAPDIIPSIFSTPIISNAFVDDKLKYQIVTFALGILVLFITFSLLPQNGRRFYKPGKLNARAEPIKWLGIKPTDTWKTVGSSFSVIVSLATGAFIYFNVAQGESLASEHFYLVPFILVLAAMNAFTQEAITRLSVVTALDGYCSRRIIYIVSALIFSLIPGCVIEVRQGVRRSISLGQSFNFLYTPAIC